MSNSELKPEDWTEEKRAELQDALSKIFEEQPEALIPMRQMLELVEREKTDQARIQELEGYNIGLASESVAQQSRIHELEAQAEKLKYNMGWLAAYAQLHDDPESSFNAEFIEGLIASSRELLTETPTQSLEAVKREAVKREAVELCLDYVNERIEGYLLNPESTMNGTRAHGKLVAAQTIQSGILSILGDV